MVCMVNKTALAMLTAASTAEGGLNSTTPTAIGPNKHLLLVPPECRTDVDKGVQQQQMNLTDSHFQEEYVS